MLGGGRRTSPLPALFAFAAAMLSALVVSLVLPAAAAAATVDAVTCNRALTSGDRNRDDILQRDGEYARFLNQLSLSQEGLLYVVPVDLPYQSMPQALRNAFDEYADFDDPEEINVTGSKPGRSSLITEERRQFLLKFCNRAAAAIEEAAPQQQPPPQAAPPSAPAPAVPAAPSSPTNVQGGGGGDDRHSSGSVEEADLQGCMSAMFFSDLSRDSYMDKPEYLRFLNRLGNFAYSGLSYSDLPPVLQLNFEVHATQTPDGVEGIDIAGSHQKETPTAEEKEHLSDICSSTKIALTLANRDERPAPAPPTGRPSSPTTPAPVVAAPPPKPTTSSPIRPPRATSAPVAPPPAASSAPVAVVSTPSPGGGTTPAPARPPVLPPFNKEQADLDVCKQRLVSADTNPRNGALNQGEYVDFVNSVADNTWSQSSILNQLPSVLQQNFDNLAVDNSISIDGVRSGAPTQEQQDNLERVCKQTALAVDVALNGVGENPAAPPIRPTLPPGNAPAPTQSPTEPIISGRATVYNAYIIVNQDGLLAKDLQNGPNRQALDDAYKSFVPEQFDLFFQSSGRRLSLVRPRLGRDRRRLRWLQQQPSLVAETIETYLLVDVVCPEDVTGTCQKVYSKFAIDTDDEADAATTVDALTLYMQDAITTELQSYVYGANPNVQVRVVQASTPTQPSVSGSDPSPAEQPTDSGGDGDADEGGQTGSDSTEQNDGVEGSNEQNNAGKIAGAVVGILALVVLGGGGWYWLKHDGDFPNILSWFRNLSFPFTERRRSTKPTDQDDTTGHGGRDRSGSDEDTGDEDGDIGDYGENIGIGGDYSLGKFEISSPIPEDEEYDDRGDGFIDSNEHTDGSSEIDYVDDGTRNSEQYSEGYSLEDGTRSGQYSVDDGTRSGAYSSAGHSGRTPVDEYSFDSKDRSAPGVFDQVESPSSPDDYSLNPQKYNFDGGGYDETPDFNTPGLTSLEDPAEYAFDDAPSKKGQDSLNDVFGNNSGGWGKASNNSSNGGTSPGWGGNSNSWRDDLRAPDKPEEAYDEGSQSYDSRESASQDPSYYTRDEEESQFSRDEVTVPENLRNLDNMVEQGNWDAVVSEATKFDDTGFFDGGGDAASDDASNPSQPSLDETSESNSAGSANHDQPSQYSFDGSEDQRRAQHQREIERLVMAKIPNAMDNLDAMLNQFAGREIELINTLRAMPTRDLEEPETEGDAWQVRGDSGSVDEDYSEGGSQYSGSGEPDGSGSYFSGSQSSNGNGGSQGTGSYRSENRSAYEDEDGSGNGDDLEQQPPNYVSDDDSQYRSGDEGDGTGSFDDNEDGQSGVYGDELPGQPSDEDNYQHDDRSASHNESGSFGGSLDDGGSGSRSSFSNNENVSQGSAQFDDHVHDERSSSHNDDGSFTGSFDDGGSRGYNSSRNDEHLSQGSGQFEDPPYNDNMHSPNPATGEEEFEDSRHSSRGDEPRSPSNNSASGNGHGDEQLDGDQGGSLPNQPFDDDIVVDNDHDHSNSASYDDGQRDEQGSYSGSGTDRSGTGSADSYDDEGADNAADDVGSTGSGSGSYSDGGEQHDDAPADGDEGSYRSGSGSFSNCSGSGSFSGRSGSVQRYDDEPDNDPGSGSFSNGSGSQLYAGEEGEGSYSQGSYTNGSGSRRSGDDDGSYNSGQEGEGSYSQGSHTNGSGSRRSGDDGGEDGSGSFTNGSGSHRYQDELGEGSYRSGSGSGSGSGTHHPDRGEVGDDGEGSYSQGSYTQGSGSRRSGGSGGGEEGSYESGSYSGSYEDGGGPISPDGQEDAGSDDPLRRMSAAGSYIYGDDEDGSEEFE